MPTLADVERIAVGLPEVEEGTSYGNRAWKVKGKAFVWERPLRKRDAEELGENAPDGDIVGVRVEDDLTKEMLCENEAPAVFTVDHFEGFDAVLIALDMVEAGLLEDLITDSWLTRAPARLVARFEAG